MSIRPERMVPRKKPALDKLKDLRLLKETLKTSPVQKKPAPDKVENLALELEYLAEFKEVDGASSETQNPVTTRLATSMASVSQGRANTSRWLSSPP
jgi:hypothetical protein